MHLNLDNPEDQEVAIGHLLSLADEGEIGMDATDTLKEALIEKAEILSCKIESTLRTDYLASLSPRDQAKARHRFTQQCKNLEAKLNQMISAIEHFQIHSY